jgi:hypothetical protein
MRHAVRLRACLPHFARHCFTRSCSDLDLLDKRSGGSVAALASWLARWARKQLPSPRHFIVESREATPPVLRSLVARGAMLF